MSNPQYTNDVPRERDELDLQMLAARYDGHSLKRIAASVGRSTGFVEAAMRRVRDDDIKYSGEPAEAIEWAYRKRPNGNRPVREIIAAVAKANNLTVRDLIVQCRATEIASVRHRAMAEAAAEGHSYCEIGRVMKRDPATVRHGVEKVRSELERAAP